ncbi:MULTISPECIES: tetratricopeptide repeat protein [Streptomyces]|uniref:tetratricopeptide repeat protein n=1 Tax=Streptomyces TaxID=1883 RepID=UPI0029B171BC|nr:tetratricopeptide repeat protein [Streptomyces sp. WI03-4A]MDX2595608.1 tetratricopeptide repeat protein [Streptomyces sp. WI03-4A]
MSARTYDEEPGDTDERTAAVRRPRPEGPAGPDAREPGAQEPGAHDPVGDERITAVRRIGAERSPQLVPAAADSAAATAPPTATDTARPGTSVPPEPASAELTVGEAAAAGGSAVGAPPLVEGARREAPAGHDAHEPDTHESVGDDRVAAVRRVAAAGRRWRGVRLVGCAALLAVALTGGAIAFGAARDQGSVAVAASSSAVDPGALGSGNLDAGIAALQNHLRSQPKDAGSWATLGLAYVEQARTKGDPARYPQAEKALQRSLALAPGNDQALAGRAALAAARHDFKDALVWSDQALSRNPYGERALSSRIDALVELGRYTDAARAARTADDRKPGVPVFTRYAYVYELRGDVTTARRVLEQALTAATSPGDVAYVAAQLGQLAWNQGQYDAALDYYARALAADENYLPALEGRARAQAATGRRDEAIEGLRTVVARYPLPGPLVELGELYEARDGAGDRARAREQYALVDAWIALARANGVNADLDTALAAAEHGDKASALRAARAEWARRHTVHTADALAWALHVNGRDGEALGYARKATATGYRSAAFRYHRGMIELATGHTGAGRASLRAALKLNPGFSPLGAAAARKALGAAE